MVEMLSVLENLMRSDNKARRQAESTFAAQLEENSLATVRQLLCLFSDKTGQTSDILRSFAGVLLRRALEKKTFSPDVNEQMREMLLNMWKIEQKPTSFETTCSHNGPICLCVELDEPAAPGCGECKLPLEY